MKIFRYVVAVFVLSVLFLAGYTLYENIKIRLPELPERMAEYHNTGKINVTVDGEGVDIDEAVLTYLSDSDGNVVTTYQITDGSFKFKKGCYGMNIFRFEIPDNGFGPIPVEFGCFNTNWWHVNDYNIVIDILTNDDGTAQANIKLSFVSGKSEPEISEKNIILVPGEDMKISIITRN